MGLEGTIVKYCRPFMWYMYLLFLFGVWDPYINGMLLQGVGGQRQTS